MKKHEDKQKEVFGTKKDPQRRGGGGVGGANEQFTVRSGMRDLLTICRVTSAVRCKFT